MASRVVNGARPSWPGWQSEFDWKAADKALGMHARKISDLHEAHDEFSQVRIHTDASADAAARELKARAFTTGRHIFFAQGAYADGQAKSDELLAHEVTHVLQQRGISDRPNQSSLVHPSNTIYEKEATSVAAGHGLAGLPAQVPQPVAGSVIQAQFITPLGAGGGFQGLMERDRLNALKPRETPAKKIKDAIAAGPGAVSALDEFDLRWATVQERVAMLGQLIDIWWTGNREEKAIVRIISTVPPGQAGEVFSALNQPKGAGTYETALDDVVDGSNNLELHEALSGLRIKTIGAERASKALTEAPVLPWLLGYGVSRPEAVFQATRPVKGKIKVTYSHSYLNSSRDYPETARLPSDLFIGGHSYDANQVVIIHDYNTGRFVPLVAAELSGKTHEGVRDTFERIGTVGSLALPGGVAKTALGKAALILFEKVLPVLFIAIDEYRLQLVEAFPKWGPRIIRFADVGKSALAIFGVARFAVSGVQFFRAWKRARLARHALEGGAPSAEAERMATQVENEVDQVIAQAEKIQDAERAAGGAESTVKEIEQELDQAFSEYSGASTKPIIPRPQKLAGSVRSEAARLRFNQVRDGYAEALSVAKGGQVHHAIELQVLDRYPGVFADSELNGLPNMRGIPPEEEGVRQLHNSKIREFWDRSYTRLDAEISGRGLEVGSRQYQDLVRTYLGDARDTIDHVIGQFFSESRAATR